MLVAVMIARLLDRGIDSQVDLLDQRLNRWVLFSRNLRGFDLIPYGFSLCFYRLKLSRHLRIGLLGPVFFFPICELLVERLNSTGEFFVFFFQSLNVQAQVLLNNLSVTLSPFD